MQAFSLRHTQSPLCGLSLLLLIAHFVLVEPIEGVYCSTASAPYVSALRLRRSNPVPSANSTTTKTELTLGLFFCVVFGESMQAFSPRHTQSPLCGLSLLLLIAHFLPWTPLLKFSLSRCCQCQRCYFTISGRITTRVRLQLQRWVSRHPRKRNRRWC